MVSKMQIQWDAANALAIGHAKSKVKMRSEIVGKNLLIGASEIYPTVDRS